MVSFNSPTAVIEECIFDRIAREYAARDQPMPVIALLCSCRRCNPICM